MPLSLPPLWVVILVILLFIFNILKSNSVIKIKEVSKKGAVKKVAEAKVAKPVKAAAKPKVKKEEVIK